MSNCCTNEEPVKRIDVTVDAADFWRSNSGADLPDYTNDHTEAISHNGPVAIGVLDPTTGKLLTVAGDVDIQGQIDPNSIVFSDAPAGVTTAWDSITNGYYLIGIIGTQRPMVAMPKTDTTKVFQVRRAGGQNTRVTFTGVNIVAGGGRGGKSGTKIGDGDKGPGGNASGGDINSDGGSGGSGNGVNGRGGGGGAPDGASGGSHGPNSGYMGNCMTDIGGIFAMMNAVGINPPLCGPNSVAGSDGRNGDRASGGSAGSRTSNSPNNGGDGGNGFVIIRWLIRNG